MADPDPGPEPVGGRVRIFRRGRVWYANFQHRGRQHRESLHTHSKKEARLRAARMDADLDAGRWAAAKPAATVAAAVAAYLDHLAADGRAAGTLAKYKQVLARVAALAADRRAATLSDLDHGFVDAYVRHRVDAGAADKTRFTEVVIVRQMVKFAVSRRLVPADPLAGLRVRKPRPTPQPCWTRDQVLAVLAASPPAVRPALTVLAETGLRVGELIWPTWADVDRPANVLHVRPKAGWRPKTGRPGRCRSARPWRPCWTGCRGPAGGW